MKSSPTIKNICRAHVVCFQLFLSMLMIICLIIQACAYSEKSKPPEEAQSGDALKKTTDLKKVYIDAVPEAFTQTSQNAFRIRVEGNLPNPAYKLDHIEVRRDGNTIEITPLAQHDSKATVIQVLKPFSEEVEIGPLPGGDYTIRFIGRSGVQETKLQVKK